MYGKMRTRRSLESRCRNDRGLVPKNKIDPRLEHTRGGEVRKKRFQESDGE